MTACIYPLQKSFGLEAGIRPRFLIVAILELTMPDLEEAIAANRPWYGIMLDDEYDTVMPDYYPLRATSAHRADVEREMWIVGNPQYWPADVWIAELVKGKSLMDPNSRAKFSGAIYRFRARPEGDA